MHWISSVWIHAKHKNEYDIRGSLFPNYVLRCPNHKPRWTQSTFCSLQQYLPFTVSICLQLECQCPSSHVPEYVHYGPWRAPCSYPCPNVYPISIWFLTDGPRRKNSQAYNLLNAYFFTAQYIKIVSGQARYFPPSMIEISAC